MTHQSQTTINKFKTMFEEEKRKLLFSSRLLDEQFSVSPEDLMDEVDLTSFELENQMKMRLRNREALYLKKIEEALARIQSGTFGSCESCEEAIEPKRLEARPITTMCISCKEFEEKLEKLHIDGHKHKSLGSKVRFA